MLDVWYPAEASAEDELAEYLPTNLTGTAYREASPVTEFGPRPVVAFSHGYFSIRFQSYFLSEHLASHGYVVVAPDHQYNTLLDADSDQDVRMMLERPDDLRFAVEHLFEEGLQPGVFSDFYRSETYAVVGHSFGAVTAMRLGGGVLDWEELSEVCAAGQGKGQVCRDIEEIEATDDGSYGGPDPRVVSTVPMSPGLWYAFGSDGSGLSEVASPLVLGGGRDDVLSWSSEGDPSYRAMGAPKRLALFDRAGHYGFSVLCDVLPGFKEECKELEAGFEETQLVHHWTKTWVTAHLGETFLGDSRYSDWLLPETADGLEFVSLEESP